MNWSVILAIGCGIAVSQSLFLGILLIMKGFKNKGSRFFWGILCVALAFRIGKSLIYYFWLDMSLWGVAIGGVGLWAIGPALFRYIQAPEKKYNPKHLLHFLPSVLIISTGAVFNWNQMQILYGLGNLHLIIYFLISMSIYGRRNKFSIKQSNIVFGAVTLITSAFTFQFFNNSIQGYAIGALVAAVIMYFMNYTVSMDLYKPKTSKKNTWIEKEVLKNISKSLNQLIGFQEVYKEQKLTLSKVAEKMNQPVYLVRQAIIQVEGKNFNDYINTFRINEAARILEEGNSHYTIEGIAYDTGFSSPSAFYEAFRKMKHCTPVQYKKKVVLK